ncbi:MAG: pyridoxal phosphate-dependent aminotransferase [Bacteroidota bacterium]
MGATTVEKNKELRLSDIAETLIGSEIIKLAWEVNEKIRNGEKIYNLTIGDFNPKIFPIPAELKQEIIQAYMNDETNYPPAEGIAELRNSVSAFLKRKGGLDYKADQIVVAGGARPLIYAAFRALVNPGDTVVFPVPSWNNNHYTHLNNARPVFIETRQENNFMPTAAELRPHIARANLIALCSPLNPTGTTFSKEHLSEICDLVVEENKRRGEGQRPLYLLYDQIYWTLTFGLTKHYDPVTLNPAIKDYTVFIDGISKSFAATGVRVGWTFGPKKIMDRMKSILGHMGAWAPKAEQVATAKYLQQDAKVDAYLADICSKVSDRLSAFHKGFQALKNEGYRVDSIAPQAAIYLTVQFRLHGQKTADGRVLHTTKDVTKYILDEGKIAIVPFYAFGSSEDSSWYRLSVGTCRLEDVEAIIGSLRAALQKLS